MHDEKAKEVIRKNTSSQTSPWLKLAPEPKRKQATDSETLEPKRKQKFPNVNVATSDVETPATRDKRSNANTKKQGTGESTQKKSANKEAVKKHKDDANKKANTKLQKKKQQRPDAIIIETKGDLSYAQILRNVKADPKLEEIGKAVSRIRRTQKGGLLLQLDGTGDRTTEFKSVIREALGEQASVRTLTQRTTIELKDVDEVTSKEDICEAVKAQFGLEVSIADIVSLRKAYGGTQTATMNLPAENASKLLDAKRIKIGWVICRIRERILLKKCFKCLEFGHLAKQCKNEEDRSKLCRKCGTEGHIAKDCNNDPSCMFCRKDHPEDAKHIAGSSKCPVFRRAITRKQS